MKPCLISYHDANLADYAKVSQVTFAHFADTYGLDYIPESSEAVEPQAAFKRIDLTLREFDAGRPFVVYADIDTIFHSDMDEGFVRIFSVGNMSMSQGAPLETSFFIANNTPRTREILEAWRDMDRNKFNNDENALLALLVLNKSFRRDIRPIPMHFIGPNAGGTVGRHFRATSTGKTTLTAMSVYRSTYYDSVVAP